MRLTYRDIMFAVMAVALLSLSACRKELCYDHDHWRVNILAGWELEWERDYGRDWAGNWSFAAGYSYDALRPEPGTGIAAVVYSEDGRYTERHLDSLGGLLPVGEGHHSILFYNDDTEYIVFNSIDSYVEATATTRTRTRSTYQEIHGNESTVNSPDMLYGAWLEDYYSEGSPDATPIDLAVTLRPLVYKYIVTYKFSGGIEYVRQARGAMAGMAQSVYLQDGRTGSEKATVLFDEATVDVENSEVTAVVYSFGVPDFPDIYYQGQSPTSAGSFGLNLEVMLPDGSLKSFEFDITDQMEDQPRGGVITVSGLEVTAGEVGDGIFDVEVGDWGEYEDIELPL